ncbi:MAG: epoxyqueuosine reductase [Anaerolineales bacterium]|nr:epoxyqueuosine reductase [Anaerolineales bacterium]
MITKDIQIIAQNENLAALGFAPASDLDGEPDGHRPEDLLPGARGLVSFAIPVPRAVYRTPAHSADLVCRTQSLLYRRLDSIAVRIAGLLEEQGEQALPIFGCAPMEINRKGDVAGFINQIRIGQAAGIGVVGRNGLLINARYGSRLMLGGVVTTALLPALRRTGPKEPGCPANCRICVDACPVKAIEFEEPKIHIMRCLAHTSRTPLMSRLDFAVRRALRPESAARLMNQTALDEHTLHVCSKCVALCPYGLDD